MPSPLSFVDPRSDASISDLGVVIVSYNVCDLLQENLRALFASVGEGRIEVIVVDNASRDASVAMTRTEFPLAYVVANTHNAGFAGAVNQGIAATRARHILLLNPDMRIEADTLSKTIAYADRVSKEKVAVIGGFLQTEAGKILPTVRRFPDVWSQLAIILKLPHIFPNLQVLKRYHAEDFDYTKEQDVDSVRGSYFVLTETGRAELGVLDSRYFIWFEEVDYCKNAISKGWKVRFTPELRATDFVGRSFQQVTRLWAQIQFTRSMVQYFAKWHPGSDVMLLKCARVMGISQNWLVDQIRRLTKKHIGIRPT